MSYFLNLVKERINDDWEAFSAKNVINNKINTQDVYFAHLVYVANSGYIASEAYAAIVDSSFKMDHNRFFFDVIYKRPLAIKNGWMGLGMTSNYGWCVDTFEPFRNIYPSETITFEDLENIMSLKNDQLLKKISSKYNLKI